MGLKKLTAAFVAMSFVAAGAQAATCAAPFTCSTTVLSANSKTLEFIPFTFSVPTEVSFFAFTDAPGNMIGGGFLDASFTAVDTFSFAPGTLSTTAVQDFYFKPGTYYANVFEFAGPSATTMISGYAISAVPEPKTYAMLLAGLGLMGIAMTRRRTRFPNPRALMLG